MKTWLKFLIISLIIGIPAFLLGPKIWPPHPDVKPTPQQLPFFIFLSAIESLFFGFGIAFIIYGLPLLKKVSPKAKNLAVAAFIAISWLLVSWWPHDNAHINNGLEPAGLLVIDYVFHLTLIISALVLSYYFFFVAKELQSKTVKQKR